MAKKGARDLNEKLIERNGIVRSKFIPYVLVMETLFLNISTIEMADAA